MARFVQYGVQMIEYTYGDEKICQPGVVVLEPALNEMSHLALHYSSS